MDFVIISDKKIPTLLAISREEQEIGLMYQKFPIPVMSFIYATPRINKFWMKNVVAALDIVFCNKNKIVSIYSGEPYSTKLIGDNKFSDLVVELPAGTCNAFNVSVGDDISLECCDDSKMKIFALSNGFQF